MEKSKTPKKGKLTESQLQMEAAALGLRTNNGILLEQISDAVIRPLLTDGYAFCKDNRLILTPRGMLLADEIVLKCI